MNLAEQLYYASFKGMRNRGSTQPSTGAGFPQTNGASILFGVLHEMKLRVPGMIRCFSPNIQLQILMKNHLFEVRTRAGERS